MNLIRGLTRLFLSVSLLFLGTIFILATSWIPIRLRGIRASAWVVTLIARAFMAIFQIRYYCPEPDKIRKLSGFVFPNHTTYMDIILSVCVIPMRFVAKEEVRSFPLVGLIARAIGCVFVKRENKESRAQAREKLGQVERYPPIVLFPEGRTGHGDQLQPFRHGAFEIAVAHTIPFLPCAIVFDRPEIVRWRGDAFPRAIWRLASRPGPLQAHLIPLEVVEPKPEDDPIQLAEETHRLMAEFLQKAEAEIEHR